MLVSLRQALVGPGTGDPNEALDGTNLYVVSGIEGIFEYNRLLLNVRDWIDTYVVTDLLGTDDAEVRDSRENNPQAHGETPGPAWYGGRTLVLQGFIRTKKLSKLNDMKFALTGAFNDIRVERPLIFHGGDPSKVFYIMCRKSQKIDIPDKQDKPNHFERNFNITLRASLPWFVSQAHVANQYDPSASGTSVNEIMFTAINNGNFEARPYIAITGPMINPVMANEANGNIIEVEGTIPAGETWVFDFMTYQPRIYRKSDGASRWTFISDRSTDLVFEPAPATNSIRLTASGITYDSRVSSYHRHTIK